jgi:hypothetical protein
VGFAGLYDPSLSITIINIVKEVKRLMNGKIFIFFLIHQ